MFENLFLLVKNNAGMAVTNNPEIPEKYRDAVIIEASSSIIEVLKYQTENGKLKELVKYFQFQGTYENPLIATVVKKFANKLNKYYDISTESAFATANAIIPPVMQELIMQSKNTKNNELSLSALLSKLTGRADMDALMTKLAFA